MSTEVPDFHISNILDPSQVVQPADKPHLNTDDTLDDDHEIPTEGVAVTSPSGMTVRVMNQDEADFYTEMVERYGEDNKLKNVSDFLELDRILTMETMTYRWGLWILSGKDYTGRKIDIVEIQKSINNYSKEIREIKGALGIDKLTRDKDKGTNFAEYMNNLLIRAEEFGIHRDNQLIEAINMLNRLFAMATLNKNSNEREQKEFGATDRDIVELIQSLETEYQKIDEQFKVNQRIWIDTLQ